MKDRFAVSMFGQKRLSREGGIEIVVKELCTRMARDGCQVTCYNSTLGLPANIVCCSRAMTKIITISTTHGQTLVQDTQKAL